MKDSLTYRQKNLALIGIFVLLAFASWKRSFKVSFQAKAELEQLTSSLDSLRQGEASMSSTQVRLAELRTLFTTTDAPPHDVQQELVKLITEKGHDKGVQVYAVQPVHHALAAKQNIYTQRLTVEGDYHSILQVLKEMEEDYKKAKLSSCKLYSRKDPRTRKVGLYADLIFQHYSDV